MIKLSKSFLLVIPFIIVSCGGGGGGGGSDPTPVTYPRPQILFSASSDSSQINEDITLTWSSTNTSSCYAGGDWDGSKGISESETIKVKKKGSNNYSLSCSGQGGTSTASVTVNGLLDFSITAPSQLDDYAPFNISVSGYTLDEGQQAELSITQISGKSILFPKTTVNTFSARAPVTYNSETIVLNVTLSLSETIQESKEVSIDIEFNNVALKYDDFFEFNPSNAIAESLETENYFVWDIIPFVRTERKTIPAGTIYCYPSPDICSEINGATPPGFISAEIVEGDFDGDGDQDVLFLADIGSRVFKSFGTSNDQSYWSSVHILWNDGTGRLTEDLTKYDGNEPPRLPAPYRVLVEDFNKDGIDDAFIGSFGIPTMLENNTNAWLQYPHLVLISDGEKHINKLVLQNEAEHQENPITRNNFAHDASMGDVDGDGDIDVFMNGVLYFNDANGEFDIVDLNIKQQFYPCCGIEDNKVDKTHAAASTMGDYNNDGYDDLVILWSGKPELYRDSGDVNGSRNHNNILLGPVDKDSPIFLTSDKWKTLPDNYYGPENGKYNDADSGDINGDGFEDIVIGSTRGTPYYAGRHVQILISNGDGTFVDETSTRFSYQPRSELDTSLSGTGIGEGVINLQDWDGDGDLDIIDTQETYGGENFAIYPRITLAINDGDGNFEEVSHNFFPKRAVFSHFDNASSREVAGTELMTRGGMIDLDGEGHLDIVSLIQGTFDPDNNILDSNIESFISSFTSISKKSPSDESSSSTETIEVTIEANSSGSGKVYVIDGTQKKSLTLNVGTTYAFNHSSSHPLRFSTTNDGSHGGGDEYTEGVTKSSGVTTIEVTSSTLTTLYYYCDVHSGMGADININ